MNTTAQQLRLAAGIIETGHPFEFGSGATWNRAFDSTPFDCLKSGYQIRPVLATPPYEATLHNPGNLTAEQVGVGYRLMLLGEKLNLHIKLQEKWKDGRWVPSGEIFAEVVTAKSNTYRLPLSVPWPPAPVDPYAEPQTKKVPLGPEDVPPFSVIRRKGETQEWHWRSLNYVHGSHARCGDRGYSWTEMREDYEINRSVPLTGRWDPNAWEPCHKTTTP